MTDREPHPPLAPPARPAAHPLPHPDHAHEGNGSLMTATLASRPPAPGPHAAREDQTAPGDRGRQWLARLFAGPLALPPVHPAEPAPAAGTAPEHSAAARASGCRDLFVIHADALAGERVIGDIARTCTDRVLVLTPDPGAADRLVERLLRENVPALRALADDENPARTSPAVSRATSAALGCGRADQSRREARAAIAAAEARLGAFAPVAKALARLAEVNETLARLDVEAAERAAARDRVEAEVRSEAGTPFAAALAKLSADHAAAGAARTAELQAATASQGEKGAALAHARAAHAEALRRPGLLSRLFGGKGKSGTPEPAELEKQVHALEAEVGALTDGVRALHARAAEAETVFTAARDALIGAEVAARHAVLADAAAAAEDERARARAEAGALERVVTATVPGEDHATAVRKLAAAREKAAEAERVARRAVPRVVVGTPGCLGADPLFALLDDRPPFDALVLDRAEELPEPEFAPLSRLAGRWVLVGNALPDGPRGPWAPRGRGPASDLPFVARVARLLDGETWAAEGDRVVCRLVPLAPEPRRIASREPLADRPEIELRFASNEDGPLLAEIAFPGDTPAHAVKEFLFNELGEVRLRPCGPLAWAHAADAITATWPAADTG
ncbi:MAG: hypothetical protein ACKODX_15135, partial [Gemmata sp.]